MTRGNRSVFLIAGLVGLLVAAGVQAQPNLAEPADAGTARPAPPPAGTLGQTTLMWDDGSFENGLGPTGGHYDGQFAMRFGGAAATTGLVPFVLRGAYVRVRSGAPGITAANVNFWHPLTASGFPTGGSPLVQEPAGASTGVTQQVSISGGPVVNTPNGSVLVGLGGLGTTSWFIDRDTNGPNNDREFAGESSNNTLVLSLGPGTLGNFGFSGNYFVRLVVDGNVPVELERVSID